LKPVKDFSLAEQQCQYVGGLRNVIFFDGEKCVFPSAKRAVIEGSASGFPPERRPRREKERERE